MWEVEMFKLASKSKQSVVLTPIVKWVTPDEVQKTVLLVMVNVRLMDACCHVLLTVTAYFVGWESHEINDQWQKYDVQKQPYALSPKNYLNSWYTVSVKPKLKQIKGIFQKMMDGFVFTARCSALMLSVSPFVCLVCPSVRNVHVPWSLLGVLWK